MTKPYIPFFAFLALLLLIIPNSFQVSTSVIPGWHATIYPPYFILEFLLLVVLLFVRNCLLANIKKSMTKQTGRYFLFIYYITIPSIVFIKFPSLFVNVENIDEKEILNEFIYD